MRWFCILSLCALALDGAAQDDPCRIPEYEPGKPDSVSGCMAIAKSSSAREWNLMFMANKSQPGCKWSAQSTFKQVLKWQGKKVQSEMSVFDETVLEQNPDSIPGVSRDVLRAGLEFSPAQPEKKVRLQGGFVLMTPKFPVYERRVDSLGNPRRIKTSGLFSPMELFPAIGWVVEWASDSKLELGLVGAKCTWKRIYPIPVLSGMPQWSIEGGPRLQLNLSYPVCKQVQWEHFSFVFWGVRSKSLPEVEIRNQLSLKAGPHLKAGLIARYTYKPIRWPPSEFSGELTLGLNLSDSSD